MSRVFDILPIVDLGNKQSRNLVFFLAGFPDNQISGWGPAIQNIVDLQSCRLILMSLPGLEDGGKIPSWGYTCQEILALMHNTILTFAPNDDHRVKLVVHDWGSFYGLAYENLHPEKVEKMIVLDVGILRKPPLFDMVRILLYQWWFCVAFIASQLLHFHVGNIIFGLFGLVPSILLVCPHDKLPRRRRDINVHMCYLYFQFWKCMFVDRKSLPKTNFPTCPILFMVRNAMLFIYFIVT